MRNKEVEKLSTSTVILIILAVAVLVILTLGFTMGWSNLFLFSFNSEPQFKITEQICKETQIRNESWDFNYYASVIYKFSSIEDDWINMECDTYTYYNISNELCKIIDKERIKVEEELTKLSDMQFYEGIVCHEEEVEKINIKIYSNETCILSSSNYIWQLICNENEVCSLNINILKEDLTISWFDENAECILLNKDDTSIPCKNLECSNRGEGCSKYKLNNYTIKVQ